MRIVVALLCTVVAPIALRAQSPGAAPDPALAAAATLERMSSEPTHPAWRVPSVFDDTLTTAAKKDRRKQGKMLMVVGVVVIVSGAVYGGSGGLAIMIAGGLMEGYGYTLYHGGK
ncbi:MAG TPA: hypothetical protein VLV16_06775 [Gemmatimonadales bacterium]|nr:hypothetical protein [Gemmatimonadales bacterium]